MAEETFSDVGARLLFLEVPIKFQWKFYSAQLHWRVCEEGMRIRKCSGILSTKKQLLTIGTSILFVKCVFEALVRFEVKGVIYVPRTQPTHLTIGF